MIRHITTGWVCVCVLLGGCSPKPEIFNPAKNPDVKRIALSRYQDVIIEQKYTKSVAANYELGRLLNARRSGGAMAGAGIAFVDPTGGFIVGALAVGAITVAIAEAETFKRRTERLNASGLHVNVAPSIHNAIKERITKFGYIVTPIDDLKNESFDPKKPVNLGKSLPTLGQDDRQELVKKYSGKFDMLLVLNTLSMGVEQRDKFGKKPTFHPFVVVGVRGYRMDTGKTVAKFELVSVAPNPLPITSDLDAAIADKAVLKKAYDDAIGLAVDEIAGDFDRSESSIQLAKPDPKAKPDAKAK